MKKIKIYIEDIFQMTVKGKIRINLKKNNIGFIITASNKKTKFRKFY